MFIRNVGKRSFFVGMALLLSVSMTGCKNKNAELFSWKGINAAADVQALSVQGMTRTELFSDGLCIISKDKADRSDEEEELFSSSAQLCIDITDQKMLYADHIYDRLYPASITKLFSAYVILKEGNLEEMVTVSEEAVNITESGAKLCGMKAGEQYTLRSLLEIMLVYSANDAAQAAAEHVGGSIRKFVNRMNEQAAAIGAVNSHFVNPHGLHDEEQYTTAYDIYLVLNELVKNEIFTQIVNMSECEIAFKYTDGSQGSMKCTSTNRFLLGTQKAPQGITIIGGKTGTTMAAGSCLSMYSKDKKGHEYISVILKAVNSEAVFSQMAELLSMCTNKETVSEE